MVRIDFTFKKVKFLGTIDIRVKSLEDICLVEFFNVVQKFCGCFFLRQITSSFPYSIPILRYNAVMFAFQKTYKWVVVAAFR